jgi:hypothetical protein
MNEDRVTAFGGVVGRVLRDATSLGTAVTAFVLGAAVLAVSYLFSIMGLGALAQLMVQGVIAVALARFALNGLSGEFRGTILSTAGGSWALAVNVAARYLVLNLIWILPALVLLWQAITGAAAASAATLSLGGSGSGAVPGQDPTGGPPMTGGGMALALPLLAALTSKAVIASFVLILFGLTVLPPVFLIVSVRAERFKDIFSVAHWRAAFSGRFADLYVVYAIHSGGIGMMVIVAIPVVLLGFSTASAFGSLLAIVAFGYLGALAVTLLGRLCGFFAFGEDANERAWGAAGGGGRHEVPPVAAGFTPRVVPGGAGSVTAVAPPHGSPAAARPAMAAVPSPAVRRAAPIPVSPAGAEEEAEPIHASLQAEGAGEPADASGRPPLPDAVARAAAARKRFETDRDGAIAELRRMETEHAPSPHVLHALALCLQQAGEQQDGLETAGAALRLCVAHGQAALAAEVFTAYWKQARDLGLTQEEIDSVATTLLKAGDMGRAVSAYGLALSMDPTDRRAIRGLLQAADHRLHREGRPKDAARIYTFLLQYAPDSPFADDMRRGLAEAEARLARAS